MAMQMWEVQQYESAAIEMCYRLNLDPYQPLDSAAPDSPPQWFKYAVRMAEHTVMVEVMRQFGRPV